MNIVEFSKKMLVVAVLLLLQACASSGTSVLTEEEKTIFLSTDEPEVVEKYQVGPGDVLNISVWGNPDLTLAVPVRPDGYISMPLVGDIKSENLTSEQLAENITGLLSQQLRNPQVTVVVSQVNSGVYTSRVRVTGAVRNPLSIPFARGMSVLDLILEAGGLTEVAAANKTRLYRQEGERLYEVEVHLDDILLRGQLDTNFNLKAGDVITVPERLF